MKRYLTILLLLISISAGATNYYVKNGGNNGAAGTSDATAWADLTKVNSTTFAAGDSIFFRRGDTFRGSVYQTENGTANNWIYYGAYGTGAKPKILGSKDLSLTSDWTNHSGNVWKTTATLGTTQGDISNLIFNNEASCGYKKRSIDSLNAQGKFFYNTADNLVYLYSASNPGTFYSHIEAAGHYDIYQAILYFINCSYIHIADLDVRYSSADGIEGRDVTGFIVERCDVSYIGGEWFLDAPDTRRVGNGIQLSVNVNNAIVRYNRVHQCYDAGISPQAWVNGAVMQNISIHDNYVTNCWYSYETWAAPTYTLSNVHFFNNTCRDAGVCWSNSPLQRPDRNNAAHVMIWALTGTVSSTTIRNNIFDESTNFAMRIDDNVNKIVVDYNVFDCDTVGYTAESTKYTTLAAWVSAMSQDAHSVSDDPEFVDAVNCHISSTSPAKDMGIPVGSVNDYYGTPRGYMPDVGAYEIEDIRYIKNGDNYLMNGSKIKTIRR
jgi:hypothetical protein